VAPGSYLISKSNFLSQVLAPPGLIYKKGWGGLKLQLGPARVQTPGQLQGAIFLSRGPDQGMRKAPKKYGASNCLEGGTGGFKLQRRKLQRRTGRWSRRDGGSWLIRGSTAAGSDTALRSSITTVRYRASLARIALASLPIPHGAGDRFERS